MAQERDDQRAARPPIGQPAGETGVPDREPDFAEEHSKPTFADEQPGGPEGAEEPESPDDAGGMDP